jgi:hypothetical protein
VDTIRFEIGEREVPSDGLVDAVNIFVNDRNLVDVVREAELPFRAPEGRPRRVSGYVGLPPEDIFLPSLRLLGEPVKHYDYDSTQGKIPVLGCGCGDVGCWPFWVRIKLRDDVVIWDGFQQPHRPAWRYDKMRPFVFDRTQYCSALDRRSV